MSLSEPQMPDSKIPIFTSIPRRIKRTINSRDFGAAWQLACIESWVRAGFCVVSLNTAEEIVALHPFASIVEFKEIPGGRTRPLVVDFFAAAKNSRSEIVGIVNADCAFTQQFDLAKRLTDHIDGLVISERVNLNQRTLRPTGLACLGFDGFFFKPASLADVDHDDTWTIGGVWSDYWLPLAFHAAGVKIQTLPAPVHFSIDRRSMAACPLWVKSRHMRCKSRRIGAEFRN